MHVTHQATILIFMDRHAIHTTQWPIKGEKNVSIYMDLYMYIYTYVYSCIYMYIYIQAYIRCVHKTHSACRNEITRTGISAACSVYMYVHLPGICKIIFCCHFEHFNVFIRLSVIQYDCNLILRHVSKCTGRVVGLENAEVNSNLTGLDYHFIVV